MAVEEVLRGLVPEDRVRLARIREAWRDLVPGFFAAALWPARIHGWRLVLHVQDNQWLHELTYWRQEFLEKLQARCPSVGITEIDAFVGPVDAWAPLPKPGPEAERDPALPAEVPAETMEMLGRIRDPALRDACAAARMVLGRPPGWIAK